MEEGEFGEVVHECGFSRAGPGGEGEAGEEVVGGDGGDAEGEGFHHAELEVGELFFGEGFSGHVGEFF